MKIVPDPSKRLANLDKHGMDMGELTMEFFENSVVVPAKGDRSMAIGYFKGRAIAVVFKPLGTEAIAPISMRRASKRERSLL
jgi:uncharacterized protein